MVNVLKEYIYSIICLGIFVAILELIIPKSNLKKQIYIAVSISMLIIIITPISALLKDENLANNVMKDLDMKSYVGYTTNAVNQIDLVEEEMIKKLKKDVSNRLAINGIAVKNINIILTEKYEISKIKIEIHSIDKEETPLENVTEVIKYIKENYDIDYSKIEVIENGGE